MYAISSLSINADRDEVLVALRKNRETHATIVKEAKEGYAAKCAELLRKKLDEVLKSDGRFTEKLSFSIPLPVDNTKAYDVAIKMLELSQDNTIQLDATQVQHFVMDDWDWKDAFMASNKMYSATAAAME